MLGTVLALSEGFNPLDLEQGGNMLWTWIIFLVVLPLAWKVVMGPVTRALEARDERAMEAITQAEKASREAEAARAQVEVKLGEAQAGAAKLMAEARERAEQREREMIDEAKRTAETLRERARADIDTAKEQALSAIRDEVVELSLAAAGQVLKRKVDAEDDRRLVEDLVSRTAAGEGTGRA